MMDCNEARALLDAWERGAPIGEEESLSLLEHIEGCPACSPSLRSLAPFIRRDAGIGVSAPSPSAIRLADDLMSRISEEGNARPARIRPRLIIGLAAAAILAIGVGLGLGFRDAGSVTVRFVLDAPNADSVAVAGNFNDWKTVGYDLRRNENGSWAIEVRLRKDRIYSYNFVIDGERWIPDPSSPETVDDGFGGSSSLLKI